MAKRSPLKVLLFLILLLVVAYLCKRGWDGFYVTTTSTSTTSSSYIISSGQPGWAVWDIPIPKKPGTYNFSAVANNNNSKYMSWSSTVSENGTFNVMNFTSTNVGGSERPWLKPRITWTDTLDRSFIPKWDFPSSVNPTKYWSLDFNYNYSEATYILTMTPPEYPVAPAPAPAGTINIVEASYGANCIGGNKGNRTSFFKSLADGKSALDYIYNFRNTGGDPAPYCPKNLDITYNCGDGVSKYWGPGTRPEAGDDSPVSLRCPVAAPPAAVAACPACPACNSCAAPKSCVDMTPYMLKAKCLLTDDDENPRYMLIKDCECPTCKQHRQS